MILDVMMSLCQVIVLVDEYEEKSSIIHNHSPIT